MKTIRPFASFARQRGVSLTGVIFVIAVLGVAGIFAMKVVPVYMEASAIAAAAAESKNGNSVRDVQNNFDKRALVTDITSIKGADLAITPNGAGFDVAYAYEKKVPLAGNASLLLEFAGSTNPNAAPAQPAH